MTDREEIMTLEEVARYIKMKPPTVYKWVQEGKIPGTKLGKEWRFRRRIIDEWIDTSIALSRGGFDLLYDKSLLSARRGALKKEDLDQLLE